MILVVTSVEQGWTEDTGRFQLDETS